MVELLDCPQEIVRDVFIRLERADLKNARITSKTFGDIGAETLLTFVHVVFTKWSLERLWEISLHRIISLRVNEIIYEADRVDHYDNQDEWEHHGVDQVYLRYLSPMR
jgi:hypothetical protein